MVVGGGAGSDRVVRMVPVAFLIGVAMSNGRVRGQIGKGQRAGKVKGKVKVKVRGKGSGKMAMISLGALTRTGPPPPAPPT